LLDEHREQIERFSRELELAAAAQDAACGGGETDRGTPVASRESSPVSAMAHEDAMTGAALRGPRGQRMRLADFRGKVVLLDLWASWCPECQLRIMYDPGARVADAFDTLGIPASYLIDPRGMIRFTHEGWDKTTNATYRREILTLLTEWSESSNRN
jgi:hypothetical protein